MNSDVKLDSPVDSWVTIEGNILKCETADIHLDYPPRRSQGGGTLRRALVHDPDDGLTVNYSNDYPGGVTLNGVKKISLFDKALTKIGDRTELVIDGGIEFVWVTRPTVIGPPQKEKVSLQDLIAKLQHQVEDLTKRVTALESK